MRSVVVFCLALLCLARPAGARSLADYAVEFDAYFQAQLAEHDIPGGAYAIVHNRKIVAMKGHGVRSRQGLFPVDVHTVFRLASLSKTFAASLTAKLVEEEKFGWEDNITSYVPGLVFSPSLKSGDISIRHILSHSSGIVPNAYDNLVEADIPFPRIISRFQEIKPVCRPGDCYGYQNVIYSLIQPVIEQVTSESYAGLMTDRLLKPLEMTDSSLGRQAFIDHPNHASPHVRARGQWHKVKVKSDYYQLLPAAGINASISDMTKWIIAQMGGNPDILSPAVLDMLTQKNIRTKRQLRRRNWRKFISDAHYGLGWRIYQFGSEELIYHSGWVSGFRADIGFSKSKDIGLVIMLNAESNVISKLSTTFWAAVLLQSLAEGTTAAGN